METSAIAILWLEKPSGKFYNVIVHEFVYGAASGADFRKKGVINKVKITMEVAIL